MPTKVKSMRAGTRGYDTFAAGSDISGDRVGKGLDNAIFLANFSMM